MGDQGTVCPHLTDYIPMNRFLLCFCLVAVVASWETVAPEADFDETIASRPWSLFDDDSTTPDLPLTAGADSFKLDDTADSWPPPRGDEGIGEAADSLATDFDDLGEDDTYLSKGFKRKLLAMSKKFAAAKAAKAKAKAAVAQKRRHEQTNKHA